MINNVTLLGRLGQDPQLETTTSGHSVCKFTIATNHKYKDQENTTWHNIVVWGKSAENCSRYLVKGRQVYISGRIENRTFEKKDGGGKGFVSEVIAENVQFLGSKSDSSGQQKPNDNMHGDIPF